MDVTDTESRNTADTTASDMGWSQIRREDGLRAYVSPDGRSAWASHESGERERLAFFSGNRLVCEIAGNHDLLDALAAAYARGEFVPMAFISLDVNIEQWCDRASARMEGR